MADVTRRSFFSILGAVAATPVLAAIPEIATPALEEIPIEYGFTWSEPTGKYKSFHDMIVETIKNNKSLIEENVSKNNPLLLRLKDKDKYIRIDPITPEQQRERMTARLSRPRSIRSNLNG